MSESNIEWTEHVWNPMRGCSRVSPGCLHCYAERDAARKNSNPKIPGYHGFAQFNDRHQPMWTGKVELIPEMLSVPMRRRKPTTYFVNSMSDLFHEDLSDEAIDQVFAVMALCPQHTFQVLTKRAERMQKWFQRLQTMANDWAPHTKRGEFTPADVLNFRHMQATFGRGPAFPYHLWPLPNVWLGVSCEDQQRADERIPLLLKTPAAIRFISAEPLLESLTLDADWLYPRCHYCGRHGQRQTPQCDFQDCRQDRRPIDHHLLDWVIVGGESGPGSRPCDLKWIRSIVQQCKAAGGPCFVKQWGSAPYQSGITGDDEAWIYRLKDLKGGDPKEWPEWARVREMPRKA